MVVLRRASQRDAITVGVRLLSERLSTVKHRQIEHIEDLHEARVRSISLDSQRHTRPFPVQVDGDYIGEETRAELRVDPGALTVVA
jgi:diacylglycerol kinase family enzyme